MPIHFSCPYCGETTLVDDPFAGHTGPCVNCGKLVTVPSAQPGYSLRSAVRGMRSGNFQTAIVLGLFGIGLLIALYTFYQAVGKPALIAANTAAAKRTCASNLKKIGQAIVAYHAEHGVYPPAYTVDVAGKPQHSWRVLILPHLGSEGQSLYRQINLNEPWDSPTNLALATRMPKVFASPLDPGALAAKESNYVAIVGAQTMFPKNNGRKLTEITDGTSNTLLLIDVKSNGHSWMEPVNLNDALIDYQIGGDLGGNHNSGANALFADGTVRFLRDTTPSEELQAMATVNGGENVTVPEE